MIKQTVYIVLLFFCLASCKNDEDKSPVEDRPNMIFDHITWIHIPFKDIPYKSYDIDHINHFYDALSDSINKRDLASVQLYNLCPYSYELFGGSSFSIVYTSKAGYSFPSVRDRNILSIDVTNTDSVFLEREYIEDLSVIYDTLLPNLINIENETHLPEKCMIISDNFGEIEVPKFGIWISFECDSSGNFNRTLHLQITYNIIKRISLFRELFAQKHWQQSYTKLSKSERRDIVRIFPISIEFFFPIKGEDGFRL